MPKPHLILMGQTPPPWHGQAVATQILFEHDWPEYEVHRLRMEFSEEMLEVGRFQWKKLHHLWDLIGRARQILHDHPDAILLYPPASAKWVPFLRDAVFLWAVRAVARRTVFIYHASGLPVFTDRGWIRRGIAKRIYHHADYSLEVAQEEIPPHRAFDAYNWSWCPCAIEVPAIPRPARKLDGPLVAIFVGSLQEGKGVLEIIRTAKALKDKGEGGNYIFQVVGKWFSNDFEARAQALRRELQVEEMVDFVGQLTGDEKWHAYAAADVFIFPTHYESEATPIVIMEALGMGLPIVSTQWAGIPAMLEGCRTAELVPPKQPQAFATALRRVRDERATAAETAAQSRQFYQDHFLPQRFIERVENALDAVVPPDAAAALAATTATPPPINIQVYLGDQNPKLGRSLGISRMTEVVFAELAARGDVRLSGISSKSSLQPPGPSPANRILPWSTRNLVMRVLTDHLHPVLSLGAPYPDLWYFPKGFLPRLHHWCVPSVVTIHDTIIQYYSDHYPHWRRKTEYIYWASMLKHTLRHATAVLTVSESSKAQILT
ncbi:MAG: glycosyltransferase, partial [Verrucomicrobiaceae bacterium]